VIIIIIIIVIIIITIGFMFKLCYLLDRNLFSRYHVPPNGFVYGIFCMQVWEDNARVGSGHSEMSSECSGLQHSPIRERTWCYAALTWSCSDGCCRLTTFMTWLCEETPLVAWLVKSNWLLSISYFIVYLLQMLVMIFYVLLWRHSLDCFRKSPHIQ